MSELNLEQLILDIVAKYPVAGMVLMGLGTLVVLGQVYVLLTPTKDDDAWYEKLHAVPVLGHVLKFVVRFAPIQRKEV